MPWIFDLQVAVISAISAIGPSFKVLRDVFFGKSSTTFLRVLAGSAFYYLFYVFSPIYDVYGLKTKIYSGINLLQCVEDCFHSYWKLKNSNGEVLLCRCREEDGEALMETFVRERGRAIRASSNGILRDGKLQEDESFLLLASKLSWRAPPCVGEAPSSLQL